MKNIKIATIFLLFSLISSFNCQSFDNFGAGFVFNLEGDFNKYTKIESQLFCLYKSESIALQAGINITQNNVTPNIEAYPIYKPHKTISNNAANVLYASGTNTAIGLLRAIYQKELERKCAQQYESHYEDLCIKEIKKGDILFEQAERGLYHV